MESKHPFLVLLTLMLFDTAYPVSDQNEALPCTDFQGRPVHQSQEFVPKEGDPCMTCTCEDGAPVMCTSVLCSPPDCDFLEAIEGECCRFHCIETPNENPGGGHNMTGSVNTKSSDTTNLGLRLVASTVTSLLILALLLFMIHRLRQKRTLITMRRLNAERQEEDAVAYMTQIDQVDIGIEYPPYQDPPPPYTPPKPHDIHLDEMPPPYTENPSAGENEGNNNDEAPPQCNRAGSELNGVRPVAGRARPESSQNNADGNSVRLNQRNQELSQANGHYSNGDIHQSNGQCNSDEVASNQQSNGTIISRGRVIESLLGRPSSSRGSPYSNSTGRKKDKKTARKSANTENYGMSVALTTLGGGDRSPETSPSHLMVQMRNNTPQTALVRFDEDYSSSTCGRVNCIGPLPDVANVESPSGSGNTSHGYRNSMPAKDKPKACPESWTQFIKKSDSIEIKRGSSSPRNSFYLEDKHFQPDYQTSCEEGGTQGSCNAAANASQMSDSNLSLLGAVGPKPPSTSSTNDGSQQNAGTAMPDVEKPAASHAPSACRHIMPPMILDLPIREASKKIALQPSAVSPATPASRGQSVASRDTTPVGVCTVNSLAPLPQHATSPEVASPQSPLPTPTTRSGSVASNTSVFSVCSETGERKDAHSNIPYALRNDVQYPLSPLTSLYSAPMQPPTAAVARSIPNNGGGLASTQKDNPNNSTDSTNQTETNKGGGSPGSDKQSMNPSAQPTPAKSASIFPVRKVIYRDADELADTANSAGTNGARAENPRKSRGDSKAKEDDDNVSCAQAGVLPSAGKDKGSGRKSKQKKRRSHDAREGSGGVGNPPEVADAPEQQRNKLDKTPSFKQYGFVDSPEVLKSCKENGVFPSKGDQIPDPLLGKKVRKESNSLERRRSRENSQERGKHRRGHSAEKGRKSRESSKSRSRSRERSVSRGKKKESPRSERRRKRRARPVTADIPSDVAVVNGDLEFSASRHSHKSRSPSRQEALSPVTGVSTVEYDNVAQQEDRQNANTAIHSELHDNAGHAANAESINNAKQLNTAGDGTVANSAGLSNQLSVMCTVPAEAQTSHSILIDR